MAHQSAMMLFKEKLESKMAGLGEETLKQMEKNYQQKLVG